MERGTATVDNLRMDYGKFGSGDKVMVLLPGISPSKVTGQIDTIAQAHSIFHDDFTVYIFDRKDDFGPTYSIEEMAEDTVAAMKALGIEKAYIRGISQGGMIAQVIAAEHPEMVEKLVLASTAFEPCEQMRECLAAWRGHAEKEDFASLAPDMVRRLFTDEFIESNDLVAQFLQNPPTSEDLARFMVMADACLNYDGRDVLSRISCPVLVLGAGDDTVVSPQASRDMAEILGCDVHIFEGYRHAVFDEVPENKEMSYRFFMD